MATFNSYEFTFNGESCRDYGLMLYEIGSTGQDDVSFGNEANIVESRTTKRIQPLHYGVDYHEEPLEFTLVFGSLEPLTRDEIQEIALWLTGYQDYKWLTIEQPDMSGVYYRCLITELQTITDGWLPYAFEATVTCDCPYAYGPEFSYEYTISGSTSIKLRNRSTTWAYFKPDLAFVPDSGTTSLSIINQDDDDREFLLEDIPSGSAITVDNTNGIITDTVYSTNLYDGFNLNFFRLVRGDNNLTVTGDGTLTISGRFLYNVGA